VIPSLRGLADAPAPVWRHVPRAVRDATSHLEGRVCVVGHSGAGVLLPLIAEALTLAVAGLIFVDSDLPPATGELVLGRAAFMHRLRALATDGVLAPWSKWFGDEAMRELVPDERLRAALEEEMPRLPLSYFRATVPMPDAWDRRACAYLLLSDDAYGHSAAEAVDRGWPMLHIHGVHHLAIATHPIQATDALLELERVLEESPPSAHSSG
jgi:Alpha/beta hydrolase family